MNVQINYKYKQKRRLIVNMAYEAASPPSCLVHTTEQYSASRPETPDLFLHGIFVTCRKKDISTAGRVLSEEDMSALLSFTGTSCRDVSFSSEWLAPVSRSALWPPLSRLRQSERSLEGLVGVIYKVMFKELRFVSVCSRYSMLSAPNATREWRSFIKLPLVVFRHHFPQFSDL